MKRHKKSNVRQNHIKRGVRLFTVLLFIGIVLFSIFLHNYLSRPAPEIRMIITEYAHKYRVQRHLVEAVMHAESKFDQKAVSHVGAVGMMQLMPKTAEWIAQEGELQYTDLKEPRQNIMLGTWYIDYLLKKYHNNEVLALAAYNAGRGNVDEWITEYGWKDDFTNIKEIPFPETREFVKLVVETRDRLDEEENTEEQEGVENERHK
ncbi:lytic transglycosylase domain-containing protein [Dialister micraerophilus]|uniref:SLT family transglycosylase n=1 Tax=Dialister micraerophilus DSM 19965 TaxID=888062 RepID=F2BW33_9FIRM|nr:lytic transglycosylase domain-containing protein [Dialister micraerophilus]EGF15188.1 SLT family transglycosylase [Dialister micraerophilus DSM 19965]MDK8253954.1 lytic transglycosylase domain-containing protein [Dialister micraerophilus]